MLLYQTHAKIHLNHIKTNIVNIRNYIGIERKILLAVKANAYGHGAIEVSRLAEANGIDYLGVATLPEALELRQANITLPILKFTPTFPEEINIALQNNITLSVASLENAKIISNIASMLNICAKIHLKIDTGMGRVGIMPENAQNFAIWIKHNPHLNLEGVFTHMPVSDTPACKDFSKKQLSLFTDTVQTIETILGTKIPLIHAANSGAILSFPESVFSMVRPGVMLYGSYPDLTTPQTIEIFPAMSLYTKVAFVKQVQKGTPIGYGCSWIAPHNTCIATLPVGYADGFNRLFSNCGEVIIKGKKYPVVGRVCMDQCMINLGENSNIAVGEQVTLIGTDGNASITINDWARVLKTITYEVTCQINHRVPRIYGY